MSEMFPDAYRESLDGETIGARFAAVAAQNGSRPAVKWPGGECSYSELAGRAAVYAKRFSIGNQRRPVAIVAARGLEMIAAILGAAMIGRPWTIVPSGLPPHASRAALERVGSCDLVCLDASWRQSASEGLDVHPLLQSSERPYIERPIVMTDAAAAICFTSGSTGAPKGVVLRHDATVRNASLAHASLAMNPGDRYLWLSATSSAAANTAIFCTLLHGACLLPFDIVEEGFSALAAWIQESRATIMHAIPPVFRRFVQSVGDPSLLSSMRVVKLGGEAAFPSDVTLFREKFPPGAQLYNGLGMSEANGNVCHERVGFEELRTDTVPIGRPLPGFLLSLRDIHGAVQPAGQPGRLHIASSSLAAGYWDAETGSVVPLAAMWRGGRREFQSEDWCQQLEDGRYVHLGRFDGIVKVKGRRVSMVGVENQLRAIEGVCEAVVQTARNARGEDEIVAWVEPARGHALRAATLQRELGRRLPAEAIPARISIINRLPVLPSGKVDRRGVATLDATKASDTITAGNEQLRKMTELFARALSQASFLANGNFFEAGGDSLAAATLASLIEAEWNCRVDPWLLAAKPTPVELLDALVGVEDIRPAYRLAVGANSLPLWLIGGAGDPIFHLLPLARALHGRSSIYGFVSGLDVDGRLTTRIEVMGEPLFAAMRRIQPDGPYLLAGTSFGGWVAFHLAKRLKEVGAEVAFLGMLDATGPDYPTLAPNASMRMRRLHWEQKIFRRYRPNCDPIGGRIAGLMRRGASLTRLLRKTDLSSLGALERSWLLEEACLIAKRRYEPTVYEGAITVFQAESPLRGAYREDDTLGWKHYSTHPVVTIPISGVHGVHMQEPHVASLATKLVGAINRMTKW